MAIGSSAGFPCGACKFMRRRCKPDCIFAPSFASEYSSEQFARMHRVFGASNLSKLLSRVPLHLRHDAVTTILHEAEARMLDPVYGCTAHLFALQNQVQLLQEEIMRVRAQLSKEVAFSRALQNQLSTATSFSDQSQPPQKNNERPPLDFQDYKSTTGAVVSAAEQYSMEHLGRSIGSDSRQPIDIRHSMPAFVQEYYSSTSEDHHHHHHHHQLFFQQMGRCDDRVGAVYQPAAEVVLAEDDDLSLNEGELDEVSDWLLLDEEDTAAYIN